MTVNSFRILFITKFPLAYFTPLISCLIWLSLFLSFTSSDFVTVKVLSIPTPIIAVMISNIRECTIPNEPNMIPPIAGDNRVTTEWRILLIALTLFKYFLGTSSGISEEIEGACIPLPIDLITVAVYIIYKDSFPTKIKITKIKVAKAIKESADIMIYFFMYLSAHTPANNEISV